MQYGELIDFLQNVGKDPTRLLFEDPLTGLQNRRFLMSYLEHRVRWDLDEHFPLSLLFVDVHFPKRTAARDEGLVSVGNLLKAASGRDASLVRFGRSSFVVLLPRTDLREAVPVAERLLRVTQKRSLPFSLAMGVASARADADSGRELVQKAQAAAHSRKARTGGSQLFVATDLDPAGIARRLALQRLDRLLLAGREADLEFLAEAFEAFREGESRFLVIEGPSGMGKSAILEEIGRRLPLDPPVAVVKLCGKREEDFRPYYLAGQAIVSLMTQRGDKGVPALDALDARELRYLGPVLPGLEERSTAVEEDPPQRREGIFRALLKLTMKLIERNPLVVLVDDLHYADEATLILWKALHDRSDTRLLVCGTAASDTVNGRDDGTTPWRRFRETPERPPIWRWRLEPLSAESIGRHLASVFPNLETPPGFEAALCRSSSGSPLVLGELLRNLVLAGRLSPSPRSDRWRVKLPRGHRFPRSVAAIVRQRVESLDEESQSLLEPIAVLGESVPLSVVVGCTGASEHDVLDFADRAEDLGLLRADFHINDHLLRFLGKPVLEVVYSAIPQERRRSLHEQIGAYLEELHQKGVGPSASILAYHFSRSPNRKKAARYAQLADKVRSGTFDPGEAQHYQKLGAQVLASLPNLFRVLVAAIRTLQVTPLESGLLLEGCRNAHEATTEILEQVQRLMLSRGPQGLLVNGHEIGASELGFPTEFFLELLDRVGLESVGFRRGVSAEELQLLLRELGGAHAANGDGRHWATFAAERALEHVFLREQRRTNHHQGRRSVVTVLENETDPDLERPEASALVVLLAQQSKEELIEALPAVGRDLLVNGEHKLARKAVRRLFADYAIQEVAVRRRILDTCRALLESSTPSVHNQLAAILAEDLLKAFREEGDDYLLGDLATLLYSLTGAILRFADFALAGRIFAELRQRQRELMKAARATGRGFTVLNRRVDSATRALLMEELQTRDPVRQERAAVVLESLGKPAIALLIDVIKQEKDFRTRQLAAGLLSGMGRDAADRIKQEVVLEVTAEQRFRILEVIDVVTRDLRSELAFCISDVNPKVRRAALRLAERLNDKQVLELLLDFARHPDIEVAKGAIRSLACLRSPHVAGALIATLEGTRDAERAIACAQALAQLGEPAAVPALAEVLTARRFPVIGPFRWDNQVRATSAFALAHIGGEGARSVLKQVANDPDPRIRQIAVHGMSGAPRPVALITGSDDPSREDEGIA